VDRSPVYENFLGEWPYVPGEVHVAPAVARRGLKPTRLSFDEASDQIREARAIAGFINDGISVKNITAARHPLYLPLFTQAEVTIPEAVAILERQARLRGVVVYFAESECGEYIKIGTTREFRKRLKQIKSHGFRASHYLLLIPGGWVSERALHMAFRQERKVGEWFRASDRLREFIADVPVRIPRGARIDFRSDIHRCSPIFTTATYLPNQWWYRQQMEESA
jgi:hypothetical protein